MAAQEDKSECVIRGRDRVAWRQLQANGCFLAVTAGGPAADLVGPAAVGGLEQPGAGIVRNTVTRPVVGRGKQRLLNGVLRGREVAGPAGEHAENLRRERAQQVLDPRGQLVHGVVYTPVRT